MDGLSIKYSNALSKQKIIKEKKKINLSESSFCKGFINCYSFIKNKNNKCKSKYSILFQFITIIIPISFILQLFLLYFRIYFFISIFKYNYYSLIKDDYLKYLITDIEDINYELNSFEIKNNFEDMGNVLFFKLYFEELISLGLLDEDKEKIFPNISDLSETFYTFIDEIIKIDGVSSLFSFSKNNSKKYIDERNDSFSELTKIYFHFYPLISLGSLKYEFIINETYLIAYQIDNNSKILGDEMYFNFPRVTADYITDSIFFPKNNFISPKISKTQVEKSKLINNSYYDQNWFINLDYNFRKTSQEQSTLGLNYWNLNYIQEESLKKYYATSLQTFINKKGKKYIINIIYTICQKKIIKDYFDFSVFILNNVSDSFIIQKFSDNLTFVIGQNDIIELILSSIPNQYFHFGLKDNNYNFYKSGIFFDTFDVNHLSEPTQYYSTIKGFNLDIRYFSVFYLFSKLFQKSSFTKINSHIQNIKLYMFNEKNKINETCSKFDFRLYKNYLSENDINCWDRDNLLYYSYTNETDQGPSSDIISFPNCICLPLYCIKNNRQSFDPNNIQFVEELILPEKCINKLFFYKNEDENSLNGLNYLFSNNLQNYLEDEYMKFSTKKYGIYNKLKFMIISIVDNISLKKILIYFNKEMNKFNISFIVFSSIIIHGLYIFSFILICVSNHRISNIIYEYKKKMIQFINNLDNKTITLQKENNLINDSMNLYNFLMENKKQDNIPLLKNENILDGLINESMGSFNINENILLNELFKIYLKYYKLSEEKIINNLFENNNNIVKGKKKIDIIINSNEIFKIFCIMSIYIPKFRLTINLDFNFYNDSKLINNFLKSIIKKSLNIDKEEIIATSSIIYELLSTEMVNDYGFITNLNFNYITLINLNQKNKNNSIQNGIFKSIKQKENKYKILEDELEGNNKNNNNIIIKLVFKNKSPILEKLEQKFEQDDYLQLKKFDTSFNFFLINICYNYLKKIES